MKNRGTDYWSEIPLVGISVLFLVLSSYLSRPVLASDADGDGFPDVTEIRYDWNSTLVDDRRKGGISRSKSAVFAVNLGGGAVVKISSDPVGLFSTTSNALPTGDALTTPTIQTVTNNKRFLYWERNGVIVRGPGGTPMPAVVEESPGNGVELVAKYVDLEQDSDGDGITDWFEMRSSGLALSGQSDDDGDGFSLAEEQNYGFSPHFKDFRIRGGISRNRGSTIGVSLGGGGVLNIASDPRGVVDEVSQPLASSDSFDTVILNPTDGNKRFVYWERMGLPVRLTGGTPTPRVTESDIGSGINMVAKYENENRDSDSDNLPDWFELRAGGLNLLPDSDPDGDGFTLAQEHRYGFSPFLRDLRPLGGISRRRSQSVTLIPKEEVPAPVGFADMDGDGITDLLDFDTDGDGSTDAEEFINGTNQRDANSTAFLQTFALHNTLKIDFGRGSSDPLQNNWNSFVSSADNADLVEHNYTTTLATSSTLKIGVEGQSHWRDYRAISSGPNMSLSNLLSDEVLCNNGGTIIISLSGLQVGTYQMTTYHHASEGHGSTTYNLKKSDASGDNQLVFSGIKSSGGTSPASITTRTFFLQVDDVNTTTQIKFGPRQGNSGHMVINGFELSSVLGTAPDELTISKTSLPENSESGTLLANLQGVDHENNSTFSYSLVEGIGDFHNSFFSLSNSGDLVADSEIDYEKNSHLFIRALVLDDFNNSLEKIFTLSVNDVFEDLDGDGIEDHLDHDLDGDGFINSNEISYGSDPLDPNSVANAPPADLNGSAPYFTFFENQPIGTIIGDFNASDPDPWAKLSYSLHGPSAEFFIIDSNGTLSSGRKFDFESDPSIFSLLVRVSDEHNFSDAITQEIHLLNQNEFPYDLLVDTQNFSENLPVGTKVAEFNASDPDANSSLTWLMKDGNESNDNDLFRLLPEGILSTADSFDFENNRTRYSILLHVIDEHNYSTDGNFSFLLGDANDPPTDLNVTASLQVTENQPVGTVVGQFTAQDQDLNSTLTFHLPSGEMDNHLFALDTNGTLLTTTLLDHEENATLTVRASVSDENNASIEKNFFVDVLNVVEDFDRDGIEDHLDPDDDNDGFPDSDEIAYGSNPLDPGSVANAPLASLSLENLNFIENSPPATVIGSILAIDPDQNASLTLAFAEGNGSRDNSLFEIDGSGNLISRRSYDFETDPTNYTVRIRASDEFGSSLEEIFAIPLTNVIEDLDGDGIEDAFDTDLDGDGYSNSEELNYGSDPRDPNSVADTLPTDLTLSSLEVLENQPAGTAIGQFIVVDPDPGDRHRVRFIENNASDNRNFTIDANNTLRTGIVFDFEKHDPAINLLVKVSQNQTDVYWRIFKLSLVNDPSDDPPIIDHNQTQELDLDQNESGISTPEPPVAGLVPIIETQGTTRLTNGEFFLLNGRILSDGGRPLLEVGFQISQSLGLSGMLQISTNSSSDNLFTHELAGLVPGSVYYYRGYARNEAGQSSGSWKRLKIPHKQLSSSWWTNMQTLGLGWMQSQWFGTFQLFEQTPWTYHLDLGWIYAPDESKEGVWFWMEQEGWLWTSREAWPYLWKHDIGDWLYYQGNQLNGRPIFYDYASDTYR